MSDWTRVVGVLTVGFCLVGVTTLEPRAAAGAQDSEKAASATVAELIDQAASAFDQEDYAEAIRLFTAANEACEGTSYEALMGLARSHYRLGRMGEAARYAFDAMELGGSYEDRADACILIGHSYLDPVAFEDQVPGIEMLVPEREENLELAAGFFRQALQYATEASPDAWVHLAQAFELSGDIDAAVRLYEAYLEENPDGPHAQEVREHLEEIEEIED